MPEHESVVGILLVEDNPSDVELIMDTFEKQHQAHRVLAVRDGAEAIDYLFGTGNYTGRDLRDLPRVIVLDLKMPRVDGIEVLRRIRADPRTQMIPVVVLTSSREEKDIEESYRLGINSYLVKPVEFEEFAEIVVALGNYWLGVNQRAPILPGAVK